jgi:hypothetical protein
MNRRGFFMGAIPDSAKIGRKVFNVWNRRKSCPRKNALLIVSNSKHLFSSLRRTSIGISSQTGNNYGVEAFRDQPLLFQVEQDLGERIDRAGEPPQLIKEMTAKSNAFEARMQQEGSFWDTQG